MLSQLMAERIIKLLVIVVTKDDLLSRIKRSNYKDESDFINNFLTVFHGGE